MAGQFVVSLDFELHWGIRDQSPVEPLRERLLGVRTAIPAILALFRARGIRATWATVGMLLARDRDELADAAPKIRAAYRDVRLDPYAELAAGRIGRDEQDDPFHFAPSLVAEIAATPGQELGTHTYSHTYALEDGAGLDAWAADLAACRAIFARNGHHPRAIVFPRNQYSDDHVRMLPGFGITAYRGASAGRIHAPGPLGADTRPRRLARLADAYLPLTGADVVWARRHPRAPVVNVPASRFFRPHDRSVLDRVRRQRIVAGMTAAARAGGDYHLWWHPHNFGVDLDRNLAELSRVLDRFGELSARYGFASASMGDRADAVLGAAPTNASPASETVGSAA